MIENEEFMDSLWDSIMKNAVERQYKVVSPDRDKICWFSLT
jgi:hypothetical protein